ncbi:MAG: penicillin-binding transpeptidase domain-containing protein [Candidatus Aminicenantales bacterium]
MTRHDFSPSYQKRVLKRTIILAFFFFLWFVVLTLRLIQLQVIDYQRFREAVIRQSQLEREIVPERGTIFDRHGKILARSLPVPTVFFMPNDKETAAVQFGRVESLKKTLDLSAKELLGIKARIQKGDSYIFIKRKINQEQADRIAGLDLNGVHFQEENKRFYPSGALAAHVLGGVDVDDQGLAGIELQYNARLAGVKGRSLILRDANKRRYDWEILKESTPGKDLILTLDEPVQYIVERELEKAVREHAASWGTVIISHPASGEILAMATWPTYDPNDYPPSPLERGRNRAIQQNFEPGSMFKIVTATAALEAGVVGLDDVFDCTEGKIRVAGWTINDHKKMGILSFPEVIIHSSNVGTIKVGQRIGPDHLYRMIQTFGFGQKTGIDLPGEENGIFHSLHKWSRTSLAAHSIGYEISVTAVQILQAMNALANRGILIPLRITRETFNLSGFDPDVPPAGDRIISERTASDLTRRVFEEVVAKGTGQAAQVDGFRVAGKTGTARKLDPNLGVYLANRHLASFVGFVPADRPMLSMVVVIDEPKFSPQYGGQVAAPVFREIARRILLYLRQAPQPGPAQKLVTAQFRSLERP